MDVVNSEQARIAEEAGACAVMALERVPADIRKQGRKCLSHIYIFWLEGRNEKHLKKTVQLVIS